MQIGAACGAYFRHPAAKTVFHPLKPLLLCFILSWATTWCNQSSLTRWIVIIVLVTVTRLLAGHVKVRKRQLGPAQHGCDLVHQPGKWNTLGAPAKKIAQDNPPTVPHLRSRDAWRAAVGSRKVASAWENLCSSIVQEFIYDSWFCQLSPDREFPACVRWQLNHAFGEVCKRAQSKRLDWTSTLVRECSAAVCSTLQLYRSAVDEIGADKLKALTAADADTAIRDVLSKAGKLHSAFNTPDGQYRTCRRLSEAVLTYILPQEDRACPMMRSLLRELFTTCLLRSMLASLAPYSINKMLLNVMGAGLGAKVLTKEQLDAAAEFELRGRSSCKAEEDLLNQPKVEPKSRKTLLPGAITLPHSQSQATATFSNSMRRSKSLGDVKDALSKSAGRGTGWPNGSLAARRQPGSKRHDCSSSSSPVRGASAVLAVGQQGQQLLADGVGAVKAAAQQLTQRRRGGYDARPGSKLLSSPPSWLPGDSPRSCTSADLSCSPDLISRLAAVARGVSTGGLGLSTSVTGLGTWGQSTISATSSISGNAAGNTAGRSPVVASSANSSTCGSNSIRTPVVAALCGLSRPPFSPTGLQGSAGPVMQQLMFGKLHAQVVSAELLSQDGKDIIVYKVRVTDEKAEWTVTRRYRHFEALHKRLKDTRHYKDLPVALPPKRLLTARDAPFVLKRRDELDCYLQGLLQSQCLASNYELADFLSQNSEGYGMTAAADRLQSIRPLVEGSSPAQRAASEDIGSLSNWQGMLGAEQHLLLHSSGSSGCPAQHQRHVLDEQPHQIAPNAADCNGCSHHDTANGNSCCKTDRADCPSACQAVSSSMLQVSSLAASPSTCLPKKLCAANQQGAGQMLKDATSSQHAHREGTLTCLQQPGNLAVAQTAAAANPQQKSYGEVLLQKQQDNSAQQQPLQSQPQAKPLPLQQTTSTGKWCSSSGRSDDPSFALVLTEPMQQQQYHTQQRQQERAAQASCKQQLRQCSGQQQPLLELSDSVDLSFVAQQSAIAPHLPSSAPVPNRILPQASTTLDSMGSVRSPGATRELSRQESDAAHNITATQQLANHPHQHQHTAGVACSSVQQMNISIKSYGSSCSRQVSDLEQQQKQQRLAGRVVADSAVCQVQLCTSAVRGARRDGSVPPKPSTTLQPQLQQQPAQCSSSCTSTATAKAAQQQAGQVSGDCLQPSLASKGLAGVNAGGLNEHWPDAPALPAAEGRSDNGQWGEIEDEEWEDSIQDSSGLIEPLYELVSCTFEMQSKGFVRRPVFAGVRGLLSFVAGGAIDEFLQKKLKVALSEDNISRQLQRVQAQLWPGGVFFARANAAAAAAAAAVAAAATGNAAAGLPPRGPPISAERFLDWVPPADCDQVADEVRQQLFASCVPAPLLALLGKQDYYKCLGDIYGMLQSKTLMYNMGLILIEALLVSMWPEVKATVIQMRTSGTV